MKLEKIKRLILSGGCSLDYNLESITNNTGYMVSYKKYEFISQDINIILDKMKDYQRLIYNKKNLFIGCWYNGNLFYLDISKKVNNLFDALEFGRKQRQKAIFDLESKKDIFLKNYKFTKVFTLYYKDYRIIRQFDTLEDMHIYINELAESKNRKKININSLKSRLTDNERVLDNYIIKLDYFIID